MTPDPVQIAAWLAATAFLVLLANGILKLTDRLKEKPIPSETYMTKEGCSREHGHLADRVTQAEADIRAIRTDIHILAKTLNETGEARASRIHARMDELRLEIKTDMRGVHERINQVLTAVSRHEGAQR